MAKAKSTVFFCKSCGFESTKWVGQCPGCREWNTFVEAPAFKATKSRGLSSNVRNAGIAAVSGNGSGDAVRLEQIDLTRQPRMDTGSTELNRVLGGGVVPGSLILVGGDPGIGKSTLLLQTCRQLAANGRNVLYISGEESLAQIRMRADRIGEFKGNLSFYCETSLDIIEEKLALWKPEVVVIDSIQTMYREEVSAVPGSMSQVRESTAVLMRLAKGLGIAIFIVGHVTKEGTVAGPRMLEHMVDTVLYFEGDRMAAYRILRAVKNRFGSTNEIGVFEMGEAGLEEVSNPSEFMLNGRPEGASGTVVTCTMEGTRPILSEVQALVCRNNFGMPRRTAAGTDYNRVNLLMAVLEKRLGLSLGQCDAYINIAGGMRISEPSIDLAIVAAILSSYQEMIVDSHTIIFGEVGLAGEVRAVSMVQQRVDEAVKLGFTTCILPRVNLTRLKKPEGIRLVGISGVGQLLSFFKK